MKIEEKAYIQKTSPIILIGSVGRILWLLSTESNSKQFNPIIKELSIFNLEKT
jgi:mannose-1-phosphate guanylyltransferase